MKMIGRHANARYTRAAAVAVTAFMQPLSVCTILLFAQNYAGQNCRTYEHFSINRRDRRSFETIACAILRTSRVLAHPSFVVSLFPSLFFFLMRRYVTGTAITIDHGRGKLERSGSFGRDIRADIRDCFKSVTFIFFRG